MSNNTKTNVPELSPKQNTKTPITSSNVSNVSNPVYNANHPALQQPPFQPSSEGPPIRHQRINQQTHHNEPQIPLDQDYQMPYPRWNQPHTVNRSASMPHMLPSFQISPHYFYPSVPTPPIQFHQQPQNKEPEDAISSVFKKTCYKCGNLGHYADNCDSDERLCYNCKKPGHETSECPFPRSTDLKQCYICREIGHLQSNCPHRITLQQQQQKQAHQQQQQLQHQLQFQHRVIPQPVYPPVGQFQPSPPFPHMSFPRFRLNSAPPSPQVIYTSPVGFNPQMDSTQDLSLISQRTAYLQNANHIFKDHHAKDSISSASSSSSSTSRSQLGPSGSSRHEYSAIVMSRKSSSTADRLRHYQQQPSTSIFAQTSKTESHEEVTNDDIELSDGENES